MSQQPEKSVAQVLRDAAAIVGKGWCQRTFGSGTDCVCASEAIRQAEHGAAWRPGVFLLSMPAWKFFANYVDVQYVSVWNDAPERTQAEVVAKLLEAADLAEREATHV